MAFGIRIKDASGNVSFDTANRLGRVVARINITSSSPGSASVPGLAQGDPAYVFIPTSRTVSTTEQNPTVEFSGTTVSWEFGSGLAWTGLTGILLIFVY